MSHLWKFPGGPLSSFPHPHSRHPQVCLPSLLIGCCLYLKVELTGPADRLGVGCERKREATPQSGPEDWKADTAIVCDKGGAKLGGFQDSALDMYMSCQMVPMWEGVGGSWL